MLSRLFITGTDTAVGKTVITRALMQKLAESHSVVVGYKPVAKSSQMTPEGPRNKDALILQQASTLDVPYEVINPVTLLEDEVSMHRGEAINYARLSSSLMTLQAQADIVVIEGTGGWRSLMNDLRPLSDWVIQEQLPVVLVVGIKLGCISHALLTAQAVINDGLPLLGWVANRINPGLAHYADIIDVLQEKIPAPLLGELPYLPRAEQRDLAGYIDLSALSKPQAVA
ncbi:dethiobiotin synthase [Mixta intestinalis]|uniref:ATP-dependent dethiobiotin synthetase BioD n=1 Tax=Mixta intestinalis TaxID=1615494 RepID=A0A6P1PZ34_9GAMM|nr:dethiobiotin synthase [Mixta intestinalis]QHM70945.1 ATP-dependent dethiobiotin synthetase BioD 1 [Mixta intestinalis]